MNSENKNEFTDELITRYLTGEAEPDEARALMDWVKEDQNLRYFQSFQTAWDRSARNQTPIFSRASAWKEVEKSLDASVKTRNLAFTWTPVRMGIAATLLLAIAAFLYLVTGDKPKDPALHQLLTTKDETGIFYLADSSKVTLFRNSTLRIPSEFIGGERSVSLDAGQAFFEVRHDAEKPFLVHTPSAIVRVLGTSFNAAIDRQELDVSVRDGKVMVYNSTDSVFLTRGFQTVLKAGSRSFETSETTDVNRWSYATGKLVFRDAPLAQVIHAIENAYPNTIRLANDDISKCLVTATFDGDSVDKILDLISEILNLTVKRDGRTFILDGEGCP